MIFFLVRKWIVLKQKWSQLDNFLLNWIKLTLINLTIDQINKLKPTIDFEWKMEACEPG